MMKINLSPAYSGYPVALSPRRPLLKTQAKGKGFSHPIQFGRAPGTEDRLLLKIASFPKDKKWASAMEAAIDQAVQAVTKGNLVVSPDMRSFDTLEADDTLKSALQNKYQGGIPTGRMPTAEELCDFILARANRNYRTSAQIGKTPDLYSSPVRFGIPRLNVLYSLFFAKNGIVGPDKIARKLPSVMQEHLGPLCYSSGKWLEDLSSPLVNLTETQNDKWVHTAPEVVQRIWSIINSLFKEVLAMRSQLEHGERSRDKNSLKECVGLVAQIHWWFAQATPYRRGSAATADMLTKVCFELLGIDVSRWKAHIAPDVWAFNRKLVDYTQHYGDLFKKPPIWHQEHSRSSWFSFLKIHST